MTKYFSKSEYSCKHCGLDAIDKEILEIADRIREAYGKPIKITSGVRCTLHNAAIGGAKESYHIAMPHRGVVCEALDLKPQYSDLNKLHKIIVDIMDGRGGVILEPSWVHIDIRHTPYRATKEGKW